MATHYTSREKRLIEAMQKILAVEYANLEEFQHKDVITLAVAALGQAHKKRATKDTEE